MMKEAKRDTIQDVKIEDEFNLPYGFGFDYVIKEKMDLINNKKFQNNRLMDDLVMKLGHMDYRDALAANKYILEAKRHGDYHQQARAKTLSLALNRMTRLKREQIEKRAQKDLAANQSDTRVDQGDRDERKLELVMAEDGIMAQVYQQMYSEVKTGAEQEMDDLKKLHNKFDYYYDKDKMADKLPSRWYNVEELDKDGDL